MRLVFYNVICRINLVIRNIKNESRNKYKVIVDCRI